MLEAMINTHDWNISKHEMKTNKISEHVQKVGFGSRLYDQMEATTC